MNVTHRTIFRCVVWTGDGRVFFYNPSLKQSLWERPPELKNRADVDKLMKGPPTDDDVVEEPQPIKRQAPATLESEEKSLPTPQKKPK